MNIKTYKQYSILIYPHRGEEKNKDLAVNEWYSQQKKWIDMVSEKQVWGKKVVTI